MRNIHGIYFEHAELLERMTSVMFKTAYIFKFLYVLFAYLFGSILFAELSMKLIHKESLMEISANHNPGASNAFLYGGISSGIPAVIGDVGKGIVVVYLYQVLFCSNDYCLALVMLAVALGHAYPIFFHFKGGMCIAASFGCLLGLFPNSYPVLTLAILYILLLARRNRSNSVNTIIAFTVLSVVCLIYLYFQVINLAIWLGVVSLSALVCVRIWADLTETEQNGFLKIVKRQ